MINMDQQLGRIEAGLDNIVHEVQASEARITLRINDHASRIRKVELKQNWFIGIFVGVGGVASVLWNFIRTSS